MIWILVTIQPPCVLDIKIIFEEIIWQSQYLIQKLLFIILKVRKLNY